MAFIMSDAALAVAANAVSANIYAGKQAEFITRPSVVRVRAAASAAGLNMSLLGGGIQVVNDQPISQANRWPVLPDDIVTQFALTGPNDRLLGTFRNTTGGALTVNHVTEIEPVA